MIYCPQFIYKIYKYLIHLFTNQSEIERICYDKELKSLDRLKLIEYSIGQSNQLHRVSREMKDEFDAADIAIKIIEIKGFNQELLIFDSMILPNLISALEPISHFQSLKKSIAKHQKTAYDNNDEQHETKLELLWSALKPNLRRSARHTSEWGEIGFQGKDPSTDFRGMGIFSLDNLVYFTSNYSSEAKEVLRNSTTKSVYPFAITGINLTSLVLNCLDKPHFKDYFYKNGSTLVQFNELYCKVFISFDKFYQSKKPETIMQFNTIKKEFELLISINFDILLLHK